MPEIQAVDNLPWQPGGRPVKYGYIYAKLTKPGPWYVVDFATVEEVGQAQAALWKHAGRQGWVIETTTDGYRLGVRRVV